MNRVYLSSACEEKFPLEIVGEKTYQNNLRKIADYIGGNEDDYYEDTYVADLILDDNNYNDPGNAVRVEIDGRTVGYLKTASAKKYRKSLMKLGLPNVVGSCGAAISGKYVEQIGRVNFGVWLDLDLDNFQIEPERPRVKISTVGGTEVRLSLPPMQPAPITASPPVVDPPTINRAVKPKTKRSNLMTIAIIVIVILLLLCLIPLCAGMIEGVIGIIQSEI